MPGHDSSLMAHTKDEAADFLEETAALYAAKRKEGDSETYFEDKNKNAAKRFNPFRYSRTRLTETGRYGAIAPADRQDSISALGDDGYTPGVAYFDPLGMKMIVAKEFVDLARTNPDEMSEDERRVGQIEDDFVARVDEQIRAAREYDFEKSRTGQDARLAMAEKRLAGRDWKRNYVSTFDAGKAYEIDPGTRLIEDVPDKFEIELEVDDAPMPGAMEWTEYSVERTATVGARIKNFFRSIFGKVPTEIQIFREFASKLPETRRLLADQQQDAIDRGEQNYDPENDPVMNAYYSELYKKINRGTFGHSIVSMITSKDSDRLGTYSFQFGSSNNAGMAGTILGGVSNPAPRYGNGVKNKYQVSYQNFLKAVAKIRGVTGSMRTYSLIGYNCASFAAEVAEAAGLPLKDYDTSVVMPTHRHNEQRVDTPYHIATFIRSEIEKRRASVSLQGKNQAFRQTMTATANAIPLPLLNDVNTGVYYGQAASKRMTAERAYQQALDTQAEAEETAAVQAARQQRAAIAQPRIDELTNRYLQSAKGLGIIYISLKRSLCTEQNVENAFKRAVTKIVDRSVMIDMQHPTAALQGPDLPKALSAREEKKRRLFGVASDEEAVKRIVDGSRESYLFRLIFGLDMTFEDITRQHRLGGRSENLRLKQLSQAFADTTTFKEMFEGLDEKFVPIYSEIAIKELMRERNNSLADLERRLGDRKGIELVRALDEALGEMELDFFSGKLFDDMALIPVFLAFDDGYNLKQEVIETYNIEEERNDDSRWDENGVPVDIRSWHVTLILETVPSGTAVSSFIDKFRDKHGLEGRDTVSGSPITTRNLKIFFDQLITSDKAQPIFKDGYYDTVNNDMEIEREGGFVNLMEALAEGFSIDELRPFLEEAHIS